LEFYVEGQLNNYGGRVLNFTPTYKAILFKLGKITDSRIWHLRHQFLEFYDSNTNANLVESVYEVMQSDPIELEKDLFAVCEETQEDRPACVSGGLLRMKVSTIKLYSHVYSAFQLQDAVARWMEDYRSFKAQQIENKQMIFVVRFDDKGKEDITHTQFHSYRTCENLYFEGKDALLQEVDFFLKHKDWYAERGLPDSLGILGYGKPGCGKTSFIKALLNLTGRHAVIFSINEDTNLETVERLMNSDIICDFPIPQNKRLYVLEDIDAMGDIVSKRAKSDASTIGPSDYATTMEKDLITGVLKKMVENENGTEKENNGESTPSPRVVQTPLFSTSSPGGVRALPVKMILGGPAKRKQLATRSRHARFHETDGAQMTTLTEKENQSSDNVDGLLKFLTSGLGRRGENHMSFLLNILDGVIETPGRMIVMTTNFINKLDPALIRPGRIDIRIEFRACSRKVLQDILGQFFEVEAESVVIPEEVADYMFIPAVVARFCRIYKRDISKLLQALRAEAILRTSQDLQSDVLNVSTSCSERQPTDDSSELHLSDEVFLQ